MTKPNSLSACVLPLYVSMNELSIATFWPALVPAKPPAVRVNGSAALSETAADPRGEPGGISYALPVTALRDDAANAIEATSAVGTPVRVVWADIRVSPAPR